MYVKRRYCCPLRYIAQEIFVLFLINENALKHFIFPQPVMTWTGATADIGYRKDIRKFMEHLNIPHPLDQMFNSNSRYPLFISIDPSIHFIAKIFQHGG